MTTTDIGCAVDNALAVLRTTGPLTPWEILRSTGIPDNELDGDIMAGWPTTNIWFAVGLSQTAYDILAAILDHTEPVSCYTSGLGFAAWLTAGDKLTDMPLVGQNPPRNGYKTPRFAPVMIGARPS